MPAVGIIYGEQSGIIRRFIHVDRAEELAGHQGVGESILVVDGKDIEKDGKPDLHRGVELVRKKRGKDADNSCMAVVDKSGVVMALISADPILDAVKDHDLIEAYAPEVVPGVTFDKDAGIFIAPVVVVPAHQRPLFDEEMKPVLDAKGEPVMVDVPEEIKGGPIAKPVKADAATEEAVAQ